MEDIKAIYSLIVKCLRAGKMDNTVQRLQGNLLAEVGKIKTYA